MGEPLTPEIAEVLFRTFKDMWERGMLPGVSTTAELDALADKYAPDVAARAASASSDDWECCDNPSCHHYISRQIDAARAPAPSGETLVVKALDALTQDGDVAGAIEYLKAATRLSPDPVARAAAPPVEPDKDETISRLSRALRVATHKPHDQDGEPDPDSGFPVCSVCGAIQTVPPAPDPVAGLREALRWEVEQMRREQRKTTGQKDADEGYAAGLGYAIFVLEDLIDSGRRAE